MKILVTGGCGFIGSALVRHLIREVGHQVVNVDSLTYAANPQALERVEKSDAYAFENANICDLEKLKDIFARHRPDAVAHLAAESHVDRSIDGPAAFIHTNLLGTYNVLEAARDWQNNGAPEGFRLLHLSTDEVFGSLGPEGKFNEQSRYDPSSAYSASKAGSDHLVVAWRRTFGLPTIVVNMCNAYGPWQFPEKLIPLMIMNAVDGKELPIYGFGRNVREWIYVEDTARALATVLARGTVGESYMIGTGVERDNIETVRAICMVLDRLLPASDHRPHDGLIRFVDDRPGHDGRYAVDARKITRQLGWSPLETAESGLEKTVQWYLENQSWWRSVKNERYDGRRLGVMEGPAQ
jgi:dTDP-glucose 4,6-dehydratase